MVVAEAPSPASPGTARSLAAAKKESTGGRLLGLDALRGLAAMAVVLHHYTARYADVANRPFPVSFSLPQGHYGVQLFFIISGFVIFMTLERTRSGADFAVSRAARLWPAFVACLFITLGVVAWARPRWYPTLSVSIVLRNLTMAPELLGTYAVDGSYWSLVHEIVFYVLAGVCFYRLGPRHTDLLCLLWLLFSLGARIAANRFGLEVPYRGQMLTGQTYSPLFVIGVMLYRMRHGPRTGLTVPVLLLALALGASSRGWSLVPISRAAYAALIVGFAALVWVGTLERSPLRFARPLVFLGDISYPLYLVHQIVGYVLLDRLGGFGLGPDVSAILTILLVVLMAFAVSRGIEKPAQRWIRRWYAQKRAVQLAGA